MDPLIRKRCLQKVTVYPHTGTQRGEPLFGEPYDLEAYITYREKAIPTEIGVEWIPYTKLILEVIDDYRKLPCAIVGKFIIGQDVLGCSNGPDKQEFILGDSMLCGRYLLSSGQKIQLANIQVQDEVVLPGIGRVPVKTIKVYQGLKKAFQNMEVIL